jgi:hypothetical protein
MSILLAVFSIPQRVTYRLDVQSQPPEREKEKSKMVEGGPRTQKNGQVIIDRVACLCWTQKEKILGRVCFYDME